MNYPFADWSNVSAPTVLMDWTSFSVRPKTILVVLINDSSDAAVTMVLETAEVPGYPDDDHASSCEVPPKHQGSFEIGPSAVRNFFRLTAHTGAPEFPVAAVKWSIRTWLGGFSP